MTIDTIESAIEAHIGWLHRFKSALQGTHAEVFDTAKARDDHACELGQWLMDSCSRDMLGNDFHNRVVIFHATFHEIAGDIATALNAGDCASHHLALLPELENLSTSLVILLNMIKRKATPEEPITDNHC